MTEICPVFAGVQYRLRIGDEAKAVYDACLNGDKPGDELVAVTYIPEGDDDEEMEDEVEAAWLACIEGRFGDCKRMMDKQTTHMDTLVLDLVRKAGAYDDADLLTQMRTELASTQNWVVDIHDLLGHVNDLKVARFCMDIGFRGDSFEVEVQPSSHEQALAFVHATAHLEVPDTTEPLCEGTSLCGADVVLLRAVLASPDAFHAAFAARVSQGGSIDYVGHLLYVVLAETSFEELLRSDVFWGYVSDRNVPKLQRVVVVGKRSIAYSWYVLTSLTPLFSPFFLRSRVDRIRRELYPYWSKARQDLFVAVMKGRAPELTPQDTTILVDTVSDALEMLFALHEHDAGDAGAEVVNSESTEEAIEKKFAAAVQRARLCDNLTNDAKLELYSWYKQVLFYSFLKTKKELSEYASFTKCLGFIYISPNRQPKATATSQSRACFSSRIRQSGRRGQTGRAQRSRPPCLSTPTQCGR